VFDKPEEEKDKGRHVDVNVTPKRAIATQSHLQPSTNTDLQTSIYLLKFNLKQYLKQKACFQLNY